MEEKNISKQLDDLEGILLDLIENIEELNKQMSANKEQRIVWNSPDTTITLS